MTDDSDVSRDGDLGNTNGRGPAKPEPAPPVTQRVAPTRAEPDPLVTIASTVPTPAGVRSPAGTAGAGVLLLAGRYQLLSVLGEGGQSVVYRSFDCAFQRVVAVKLYRYHASDPRAVEEALAEARRLSGLRHEHIVRVFDAGLCEWEGIPGAYVAMEEVEHALPIHRYCEGHRCTVAEICRLVARVAEALHAVHLREMVHRDVKPGNILVSGDGVPQLVDMGLARLVPRDRVDRTSSGAGTRQYMAPEQFDPGVGGVSPRTDVWALGLVLWRLVAGREPYFMPRDAEGAAAVQVQVVPDLCAAASSVSGLGAGHEVPEALGALVAECTRRDPARRPASAREVAEQLTAIADDLDPARASDRRRPSLAAAVLVLVLLAMTGVVLTRTGGRVLDSASQLSARTWAWLVAYVPRQRVPDGLRRTAVVALMPEPVVTLGLPDVPGDDVEGLARALGITGVKRGQPTTYRPLTAEVVRRIGRVNASTIAVDVYYRQNTPADAALREALLRTSVPVVLASANPNNARMLAWRDTTTRPATVVAALADLPRGTVFVRGGGGEEVMGGGSTAPWIVDLAYLTPGEPPIASLALLAAVAARESTVRGGADPLGELGVDLDGVRGELIVGRHRFAGVVADQAQWLRTMTPTVGQSVPVAVGTLVDVPSDDALKSSTLSYTDVLLGPEDELARKLAGRAVLLANARPEGNMPEVPRKYPGGRDLMPYQAVATAIDRLVTDDLVKPVGMLRLPFGLGAVGWQTLAELAAALVAAAVALVGKRFRTEAAWMAVLLAVTALAALSAYVMLGVLFAVPLIWLAAELGYVAGRVYRIRGAAARVISKRLFVTRGPAGPPRQGFEVGT